MKNQLKSVLIVGGLLSIFLLAIVQSNAAPTSTHQHTATIGEKRTGGK